MSRNQRNQKLSDSQILTIKHLSDNGVQTAIIANVLKHSYGLSKCVAYYHLSHRQQPTVETQTLKDTIRNLIRQDKNTQQIAVELHLTLEEVNSIYIK